MQKCCQWLWQSAAEPPSLNTSSPTLRLSFDSHSSTILYPEQNSSSHLQMGKQRLIEVKWLGQSHKTMHPRPWLSTQGPFLLWLWELSRRWGGKCPDCHCQLVFLCWIPAALVWWKRVCGCRMRQKHPLKHSMKSKEPFHLSPATVPRAWGLRLQA